MRPDAKIIDVTLRHYGIRSWGQAYGGMFPTEMVVSADVREVLEKGAHKWSVDLLETDGGRSHLELLAGELEE